MLGTISVERNDVKLTSEEVKYWKRIFKQNLKIGVEIESYVGSEFEPSTVRTDLMNLFSPTNNVSRFGKCGVCEVKSDGSVDHGFELCTVGRRPAFLDLYYQYKSVTDYIISKYKALINSHCGLHNHVLLDYHNDVSSLEQPVPGIIMKNFIQLLRRYMPELVYITSTIKDNDAVTRYEHFCTAERLMQFTPISRSIKEYRAKLLETSNERYQFINLIPLKCISNEEINTFHFELRFPDGSVYPAQIAGQNMLYAAILLKAIELSELGVINTGTAEEWSETKELYSAIRNDYGSSRTSRMPSQAQLERIKQRAFDMLIELKAQLDQYDTHIYGILYALALEPISLQRRHLSDVEINRAFDNIINNMYFVDLSDCMEIIEAINLQTILHCNNQIDYETKLGRMLNKSLNEIQKKMFKLNLHKPIEFDSVIGAMKFR